MEGMVGFTPVIASSLFVGWLRIRHLRLAGVVSALVFRKAPNGAAFLEQVLRATGLAVEVVTQDAEARLGFLTACAISPRPRSSIIAWDSGGGSFQISAERSGALAVYSGALGSSVVTALMVEAVQRASLSAKCTPNPVSVEQAEELVRILTTALPPAPTWLRGSAGVSAIGGPNSLFNSAAMVIRSESIGGDCADAAAPGSLADAEGFVVGARPVPISCKDVRSAVYARCGESDETLEALGYSEPGLLVPKLCLLVAVMEHAQLERIEFLPAIGACPGVLVDEERFGCGERSWPPARLPS
ncbi:hypothetical protein T492DRAFT_1023386 [Pavlovales sp. CCMP2436]|nr:hypothetical protein T492DRAFT_1023386 [Pavlovales sp. CCMP2436]